MYVPPITPEDIISHQSNGIEITVITYSGAFAIPIEEFELERESCIDSGFYQWESHGFASRTIYYGDMNEEELLEVINEYVVENDLTLA